MKSMPTTREIGDCGAADSYLRLRRRPPAISRDKIDTALFQNLANGAGSKNNQAAPIGSASGLRRSPTGGEREKRCRMHGGAP
jgi:hypothetical protein